MVPTIEYVPEADTLAVVTLKETQSASLRTTNAILIALRQQNIYLMYCHLALINIWDLTFNVFFSLLFVANGSWTMGDRWCSFNAASQQFVQLYTLLFLMLMAAERAFGAILVQEQIVQQIKPLSVLKIAMITLLLFVVSVMISSVIFFPFVPVKAFRNRYICGVDIDSPLGYVIARVVLYFGCLAMTLVCIVAILRKKTVASIPLQSHEYAEFIKKNRAVQHHKSRAKLVILLVCVFILLEGPYVTLCFIYETYNSHEFLEEALDVAQDTDTLITWLKFIFPLLCPIIMLCWCNDVWVRVKEVLCCRSYDPPTIGHYMPQYRGAAAVPSVMTLVATDQGVQLKMPQHAAPHLSGGMATSVSNRTNREPQNNTDEESEDLFDPPEESSAITQGRQRSPVRSQATSKSLPQTSRKKKQLHAKNRRNSKPASRKAQTHGKNTSETPKTVRKSTKSNTNQRKPPPTWK
ncbi:unnamed protein product [Caenorhabditis auriculariae]|uniref:G-protein coupled receptors family 1 profile domain-containing protein n=1 Tax=Caenorhabditis auriculariae TaxID=2777116 RepID=A0A8S1H7K3_9PELO|nr:unnamed protein product [Caenorhabditis auriculariae]